MLSIKLSKLLLLNLLSYVAFGQPQEAQDLFEKGLIKNQSYHFIDASVFFTQAIALEPEFAEAYYQRGLSFEAMGKSSYAIKDFNRAIYQDIKNVEVYLKLITYYKNLQQYQSAILICQKLIQAMPENAAGAYYDLGEIYETMNNVDLAIKSYQQSLLNADESFEDFRKQLLIKIESLKSQNS
ncbi:MAG: tetratricopeptide repeat protein [Marinicellaceae bacterium]